MSTTVQITRYPNRRMYARNDSKYVSLQEIEEMVQAGNTVEIRDSQTKDELTRSVLARIIVERQPEKMQLFPVDLLHFILRSNSIMSDFLRDYFRQSLPYLEYLQRHSAAAMHLAQPMHWMKAWIDGMQTKKPAEDEELNSVGNEVNLARRIAELEDRIRQLEAEKNDRESRDL